MPHYEYLCDACQTTFELILTLHEHEQDPIKCPKCGSEKVHQEYSAFTAVTSRKS